ncbi:MAG: PAS domain S-box protein [Spirochaetota bacterium]
MYNDKAEIIGVTAFARDITERKQAEIALQETEQRYRELFAQMNEGLIVMTMEGRLFEVNPAFAEMHGYTVDELKSVDIGKLDVLCKRTLEDRADILRRIQAGEIARFEVEHYHKDGHIFRLGVTASMIKIGSEPFYLAFHQDITERK